MTNDPISKLQKPKKETKNLVFKKADDTQLKMQLKAW